MNTNWSQPKTNIFSAMLSLRLALQSRVNARLVRIYNEDCSYPIRVGVNDLDFRSYKFNVGKISTVNKINTQAKTFGEKLSLNYISCFGIAEAVETYYKTGRLSEDNFKGIGRSHLVNVDDAIKFFTGVDDARAKMYYDSYRNPSKFDESHFFDNFRLINETKSNMPKHFNHKVWAVEILDDSVKIKTPVFIKVINVLTYPFKFIPKRTVLRMSKYTLYTYSIGSVFNGYNVQFQIPKKFSFK